MCFHIVQTNVEAPKHVGEFLIANRIAGARGIESP